MLAIVLFAAGISEDAAGGLETRTLSTSLMFTAERRCYTRRMQSEQELIRMDRWHRR